MRAIASRVGITAAGLYAHYPSKAAILGDFVEAELNRFVAAVESACEPEPDPRESLRRFAEEHVGQSLAEAELGPFNVQLALKQLAVHLPAAERQRLAATQRRHLELLKDILRRGVEGGEFAPLDVTPTAFAILTMCDFVTNWYRTNGRLSPGQLARHHAELVLKMVGGEMDSSRGDPYPKRMSDTED
jgi:AcrR family transcriptional regulator